MSYYTVNKAEQKNYVVLKHPIAGINTSISGVKFRDSYAVVVKDSKVYFQLKKLPHLKNSRELPLEHLKQLPFISRDSDIHTVYGREVYYNYCLRMDELKLKDNEAKAEYEESRKHKCKAISNTTGKPCENDALVYSPSSYCINHLIFDPKLKEHGIEVPHPLPRNGRKQWMDKVKEELQKQHGIS